MASTCTSFWDRKGLKIHDTCATSSDSSLRAERWNPYKSANEAIFASLAAAIILCSSDLSHSPVVL